MLEISFRIHRDDMTRTLDWLSAYDRTAKIGFDPIATERRLRRNGRWKRQRQNGNGMVETRHYPSPLNGGDEHTVGRGSVNPSVSLFSNIKAAQYDILVSIRIAIQLP